MWQVLFIVWRESVEALLIIGILYAWLNNKDTNTRSGLPYLWGGVIVGIIIALTLGIALLNFTEILSGEAQTYFQISMVLIAAGLIIQTVFWMRKHGNTTKKHIESSLSTNYENNNFFGIFILAMLAVAREGSETAIFLYTITIGQHIENLILASILGFILAFLSFYLLQLGHKIFAWRYFFQITEIILLLLAGSLLLTGIEKLIDLLFENSDWFSSLEFTSTLTAPLWDTSWLVDDSNIFGKLIATLTGYRAKPALISVTVYILYWLILCFTLNRSKNTTTKSKSAI